MSALGQLRDEVTIRSRRTGPGGTDDMTLRAHVYSVDGVNPTEPNRPGLLVTQLRVLVPGKLERPLDASQDDVIHHGTVYRMDGPPMGRYRRGKVHHWTIKLERVDG